MKGILKYFFFCLVFLFLLINVFPVFSFRYNLDKTEIYYKGVIKPMLQPYK